jgi:sugar phosphate isomerase/epimerase
MFDYTFKSSKVEKLSLFKEHGFDFIHWCDNWSDDVFYSHDMIEEYVKLLSDIGLVCLDVHGTATQTISIDTFSPQHQREYIKLLENRIDFCHIVGGDSVVVHPPTYHASQFEERMTQSHKVIQSVENLCQDKQVCLAFENVRKDDHLILMEYFDRYPEFVGFCYDSGHANIHDNLDELMGFDERLMITHLHDNMGKKDDHQYPGWGNIDWRKVTDWLKKTNHKKPWNLEVTHSDEFFSGSLIEYIELVCESASETLSN